MKHNAKFVRIAYELSSGDTNSLLTDILDTLCRLYTGGQHCWASGSSDSTTVACFAKGSQGQTSESWQISKKASEF